jgi:hypothetical protein
VRVLAAQEGGVEHPREMHVVDELRAAGEEALIFVSADRLTDEALHVSPPPAPPRGAPA